MGDSYDEDRKLIAEKFANMADELRSIKSKQDLLHDAVQSLRGDMRMQAGAWKALLVIGSIISTCIGWALHFLPSKP